MTIMDGLRNIVANLGTDRDKAAHSYYYNTTIADDQLVAMYRTSAIARNVVDLPAEDATREWREWQADAVQISAIEAEEMRLGLQGKTMQNLSRAAVRRRCHLYRHARPGRIKAAGSGPDRQGRAAISCGLKSVGNYRR